MAKQFADRGLEVNEDVLRYVAARVERSFATAAEMVARIDRAALAQQRKVTLAMVRGLVNSPSPLAGEGRDGG